jgi:hypothetical protein
MKRFQFLRRGVAAMIALGLVGIAFAADPPRPIQGTGAGTLSAPVPHPDGVHLIITGVASGEASHLGAFTREETVLLDPVAGVLEGSLVYTAANGDELRATFSGGFIAPGVAVGTYQFTGGTGRFVNASGTAVFQAETLDFVDFTVTFSGTIAY